MSTQVRPGDGFVEFPREAIEQSIPARFEWQVVRHPDRLAVKTGKEAVTYLALNRRANQIARAIVARRGDRPEPVALLVEQGPSLLAAILGILKAGMFYVPLDGSHPRARIAYMLDDCGTRLVVADATHRSLARELAGDGREALDLASVDPGVDATDLGLRIAPERLAYVYYTSGSTGHPKGVMDTHRNVLHNIMRYTNGLSIGAGDRLTLLQSPSFSGAVSSMFGALLNGAAVFPFDLARQTPTDLADFLVREQITIYHSVPTIFRGFLTDGRQFPGVRVIRLEGDQAAPIDVELYQRHFGADCVLVNGLGATEMGIVRRYFIGKHTPVPRGVVPIGHAVPDMEVILVDDEDREVPAGSVGEISVRSSFLSPGYWGKPELTARAFVADPHGGSQRMYRTGDVGRMGADGCLEHLGRKDFRVKIRGQTVDVAEIELALRELPSVAQAVVVARLDSLGEQQLAAYLVAGMPSLPSVSVIRRRLATRLPAAMIPSTYTWLDALPLDANGKVDRRGLPAPAAARPQLDSDYVPPTDLLQDLMVHIWEEMLGVKPVGIRDEFLDLGGDSLLAVAMIGRVAEACGIETPVSWLLGEGTVERLSEAITRRQAAAPVEAAVAVQPAGSKPPFYFLHGDYRNGGMFCRALARELGPDQPFYALTPCGLDGGPILESVEDMAAYHLRALRAAQPRGPYYLGGNCNGGLIAYEMARRLHALGEEVALLLVVRTSAANARYQTHKRLVWGADTLLRLGPEQRVVWLRHLRWYADACRGAPLSVRIAHTIDKITKAWRRLAPSGRRQAGGPETATRLAECADEPDAHAAKQRQLADVYMRIAEEYVPGPYPGRVTVLWPADDEESPAEAGRWWRHVAAQVDLQVVPGNHLSFVTRHVSDFADRLQSCLHAAALNGRAHDRQRHEPPPFSEGR